MCGITGYLGDGDAIERQLGGLRPPEDRGYDSAGIAIDDGAELTVLEREGELDTLERAGVAGGHRGIGQTRWSTHGPPSDRNDHPHVDCGGRVGVLHDEVVENYGRRVTDRDGHRLDRRRETVDRTPEEIHDQPSTIERTLQGRVDETLGTVAEVSARGVPAVRITSDDGAGVRERVDHAPTYPDVHPAVAGVLARSVTVE